MTTHKEALKLALEALYFLPALSPAQNELQDGAIEAIEEALQSNEQVEPVEIHQYSFKELGKSAPWYDGTQDQTKWPHHIYNHRIVYTTPQQRTAVPEGWKLVPNRPTKAMWDAWDTAPFNEDESIERNMAWSLMLAAAPQQRTWVGLSEKEMYKLWLTADEETDRMAFGKAVEAKIKEKNT